MYTDRYRIMRQGNVDSENYNEIQISYQVFMGNQQKAQSHMKSIGPWGLVFVV